MLRMGKSPKAEPAQPGSEHTTDNPATSYNAPRTYPTYQNPTEPASLYPQGDTATTSRAVSESESLARNIKEGTLSGYVGNGTMLKGDASFKAMLRVDGHLSGTVNSESGTLLVGTNGIVDANIKVAVATIHGTINGDIIATQRLELGRTARVNGNIQAPSLMIEQGAIFEGSCRMVELKAAQDKSKKREERATGPDELIAGMPVMEATEPADLSAMPDIPS